MEACPKCNFVLAPEALECPACGVILAKLKAVTGLQRPIQPVAAAVPSNPDAPPAVRVERVSDPPPSLPLASEPARDVITLTTLEALEDMRPWMRFFAVLGLAFNVLLLLAFLALLTWGGDKPDLMPVALMSILSAGVGFAILLPLNRSAAAIADLQYQSASGCLETFAQAQATFWRRIGALLVAYLVIIAIFAVLGGLSGTLTSGFH